MKYPIARKANYNYTLHGETVKDDYIWMEDADSEETRTWVHLQNEYTKTYFSGKLSAEIEKTKIQLTDKPKLVTFKNITMTAENIYALCINENGETGIVVVDDDFNVIEEIQILELLNFKANIFEVKINPVKEELALISAMIPGNPKPTTFIVNLLNRQILKQLDNIFFSYWFNDGERVLLSKTVINKEQGINENSVQLYHYSQDRIVKLFAYDQNSLFISCRITSDDRYVVMNVAVTYSDTRLYFLDVMTHQIKEVGNGLQGLYYYIGNIGPYHYIQTNYGYDNGAIYRFTLEDVALTKEKLIIHSQEKIMDNIFIGSAFIESDKIYVTYLENAVSQFLVYDSEGNFLNKPDMGDDYSTLALIGKSQGLYPPYRFFVTESFIHPQHIIRLNIDTNEKRMCYMSKRDNSSELITEQIFVTSRDGERIPAFITRRKDTLLDGSAAAIMFGYGGYGLSVAPHYKNGIIGIEVPDWVMEGNLYISCNIRGGSEYGQRWHNAGKLLNKKNAFNDFIDITEWLIANKYMSPHKIAIVGCSNGGLLVSALATMRPDLYRVVIDSVPHTDMLRFQNDPTGPMYRTEYGDVNQETYFHYLLSYSPYHNIKQNLKYPAVFIQSGEKDNNVPPYHAKKFAARLQDQTGSEQPILLRILANGGHNRGTGTERLETYAEFQVFIRSQLGLI